MLLSLLLAATPFPEVLTRPTVARLEQFSFPPAEAFTTAWNERPSEGHQVVRGALKLGSQPIEGWFLLVAEAGVTTLRPLVVAEEALDRWSAWTATSTATSTWHLTRDGTRVGTLEVLEAPSAQMSEVDLVPWTYVQTLVATATPLYEPGADFDAELTAMIDGLSGASLTAWAKKHRADDALFRKFARFRPMGSCSMDTAPQEAARAYAELAFARGDLAAFLQLQVAIMGDRFERVAWSSFGEAAHSTEAERLIGTGVDVDQFLLGLVISRPGDRATINTWRLARSIREAGRRRSLEPVLERLAQSPSTDAYDRLRAVQVLLFSDDAFAERSPEPGKQRSVEARRRAAVKRLERLSLSPVAKQWLLELD